MKKIFIGSILCASLFVLGYAQITSIPGGGSSSLSLAGTAAGDFLCNIAGALGPCAAGTGIAISSGSIATDDAIIPQYSKGADAPSANCTAGRDIYTDTTADVIYTCIATNTWKRASGNVYSVVDTGGDDTYAPTCPGFPAAYADGQTIILQATTANTGAATLDCGPGAKAIKLPNGSSDPANSDITAKRPAVLQYDSSADSSAGAWIVQVVGGGGSSTVRDSVWLGPYGQRDNTTNRQLWQMSAYAAPTSSGTIPNIVLAGVLPDAADTEAVVQWVLPANWDSTAAVDVYIVWYNGGTTSNSWRALVKIGCVGYGSGESLASPSFNTTSQASLAHNGQSDRPTRSAFTSMSMTNCAAGEYLWLSITRDGDGTSGTDDLTTSVGLVGAEIVFTRTNP